MLSLIIFPISPIIRHCYTTYNNVICYYCLPPLVHKERWKKGFIIFPHRILSIHPRNFAQQTYIHTYITYNDWEKWMINGGNAFFSLVALWMLVWLYGLRFFFFLFWHSSSNCFYILSCSVFRGGGSEREPVNYLECDISRLKLFVAVDFLCCRSVTELRFVLDPCCFNSFPCLLPFILW